MTHPLSLLSQFFSKVGTQNDPLRVPDLRQVARGAMVSAATCGGCKRETALFSTNALSHSRHRTCSTI